MFVDTTTHTLPTDPQDQIRIGEFMRVHVSRYVLPGKLADAQRKGAATVSVPTADMSRLLAHVGFTLAPVATDNTPEFPAALESAAAELVGMLEWDAEGFAILTREQVEALAAQAARIGFTTPRPVKRRTPTATLPEKVAQAQAEHKRNVSVPTDDLARMLEQVEQEKEARRPHYAPADYVVEVEHQGKHWRIEVPPQMSAERRAKLADELHNHIGNGRIYGSTGIVGGMFRFEAIAESQEVAA